MTFIYKSLSTILRFFLFLLTIGFLLFTQDAFSQAVPTPQAPRVTPTVPVAYAIYHESDAQNQIEITWDQTVTLGNPTPVTGTGWTVVVGGVTIPQASLVVSSSGTGTSSKTTITFPAANA